MQEWMNLTDNKLGERDQKFIPCDPTYRTINNTEINHWDGIQNNAKLHEAQCYSTDWVVLGGFRDVGNASIFWAGW